MCKPGEVLVPEHIADIAQVVRQRRHIRRRIRIVRQPGVDFFSQSLMSDQILVQKLLPQPEREGYSNRTVVRDSGPQYPEVGRLAPEVLRGRWQQPVR